MRHYKYDKALGISPLLWYLRYDVELEKQALETLGVKLSREQVNTIKQAELTKHISTLDTIGAHAAEQEIKEHHFPLRFDRPGLA